MWIAGTRQLQHVYKPLAHARNWVAAFSTLAPGQQLSLHRAFTAADIQHFTQLTGDSNPLHTHQAGAAGDLKQDMVVPGMLMASLFPAIIGSHFPGALYLKQDLSFRRVCCAGDQLQATVTVQRVSGRRTLFATVIERQGEVVVDGTALALMPASEQ